jgi:hypothetical protein
MKPRSRKRPPKPISSTEVAKPGSYAGLFAFAPQGQGH